MTGAAPCLARSTGPARSTTIQLWTVRFPALAPFQGALAATLSPDERARASRFKFPRDQNHFILGRGFVRHLLAQQLSVLPAEVELTCSPTGKPHLAPKHPLALAFSVAHSSDLLAVGFGLVPHLGIDLERVRPIPGCLELARTCFAATEQHELAALHKDMQLLAFLSGWTRKEALLKASGDGIAAGLGDVIVSLDPRKPPTIHHLPARLSDKVSPWTLLTFSPEPEFIGAVACGGALPSIQWHSGPERLLS